MALCTAAQVIAIAKEFASVPIPEIEGFIELAEMEIDEEAWGSRASLACRWLTAHLMSIGGVLSTSAGGSSAAGAVTSISVGDVSVGYASPAGSDSSSNLSSTRYGVEYARLISLAAMGAALAVDD